MAKKLKEKVESQFALTANSEIIRVSIFMSSKLHDFEVEEIGPLLCFNQFNFDALTLGFEEVFV